MIMGIGTDVEELARVRKLLGDATGERLVERILSERERTTIQGRSNIRSVEFVTGRFAAKEAVAKAFGCGIGEKLGFHDIEILPDSLGKPIVQLSERSKRALHVEREDRVHLSISHSDTIATAFAVWER